MKPISFLVLACLVSAPVFAQGLPDEINDAPYQSRYEDLAKQTDAATAELSKYQSALGDTRRFIREMTGHIAGLQQEIADSQDAISDHRQTIPRLQVDLQRLRSEESKLISVIRQKDAEESSLSGRYDQEKRRLDPMEDSLNRRVRQVNDLRNSLQTLRAQEKQLVVQIDRSRSELSDLERTIRSESENQRRMAAELNDAQGAIKGVEGAISGLEGQLSPIEGDLRSQKSQLQTAISQVRDARRKLQAARQSNADAATISRLESELRSADSARDAIESRVRDLESRASSLNGQISSKRSELSRLNSQISSLPSRIRESESREREATSRRSSVSMNIPRYESDLSTVQSRIRSVNSDLSSAISYMRSEEQSVLRQRGVVQSVVNALNSVRSDLQSLDNNLAQNRSDIQSVTQNIQQRQTAIPELEALIRKDQSGIASGQHELSEAKSDAQQLETSVSMTQNKVNDLTARRDAAQTEATSRTYLFNRYLNEARDLGRSQTADAKSIGRQDGVKLMNASARQNSEAAGLELGSAKARYWGLVRGEISGHKSGLARGRASEADIAAAKRDADSKAAIDAENHAQKILKPQYFEERLQAAFRETFSLIAGKTTSNQKARLKVFSELSRPESVSPLSPNEIAESNQITTPLDQRIAAIKGDLKTIIERSKTLGNPEVVFKAPSIIPYSAVNCEGIYKNVKVYKDACEAAFRQQFSMLYLQGAQETFKSGYEALYTNLLSDKDLQVREQKYPQELKDASVISSAEGEKIGKQEIYQETYAVQYQQSYQQDLVSSSAKAKSEAGVELANYRTQKPLLTVSSKETVADAYMAGEEVGIKLKVKNISAVPSTTPVTVTITDIQNGSIISGSVVGTTAVAQGETELPLLKVKVAQDARGGSAMAIKGTVALPGDLYKPVRQEQFVVNVLLGPNPFADIQTDYNAAPPVKGVFSRYVHTMTVSLAPTLDDLSEGYIVSIRALNDASVIEFKTAQAKTAALKKGQKADVDLSYSFKDQAKGKTLQLELSIKYGKKVVQTNILEVKPR